MKWANKKTRQQAILKVIGLTALPLSLLGVSLLTFLQLPSHINPPPIRCETGQDVMAKYSAAMDSTLMTLPAIHLLDGICLGKINSGDRLIRIAIGRTNHYWRKLFEQISNSKHKFFWRETGPNRDYRVLYLGPLSSEESPQAFLVRNGLGELKLGSRNLLVERIEYNSSSLYMYLETWWPVKSNQHMTNQSH